MKLSKQQVKNHEQAEKILSKDVLSFDDKIFVYENWLPSYHEQIGKIGAFFTPSEMADDLQICCGGKRVIDLCAGIGMLAFTHFHWRNKNVELVCVERSEKFVSVGRKLLPEATWIHADVLDEEVIKSLGRFDCAISNPPFGRISTSTDSGWLKYKGSELEYKVIDVAAHIADTGAFILPQMSTPFRYSGKQAYSEQIVDKCQKFIDQTGLEFQMNCGIDLSIYQNEWVGTSQICEIAIFEFPEKYHQPKPSKKDQFALF